MSTSKIRIIDQQNETEIYSFEFHQQDEAYAKMIELEEMGLDVKLIVPTVTESLCDSLGIKQDEKEDYQQSVVAEIEDHDGSCCASPNKIDLH